MKIYTQWTLAQGKGVDGFGKEFPAVVPGAVQLDYARFAGLPDYKFSDNHKLYEDLKNYYWKYTTAVPERENGKRLFFVTHGVDYRFDILLGGKKVHEQEGMFRKAEVEITAGYEGKELSVIVYPAPCKPGMKDAKEAEQSFKPPVCYGWDFQPRLITQGIWEDTYFETREQSFMESCYVTYELKGKNALINVECEISGKADQIEVAVLSPDGEEIFRKSYAESKINFELENVELWWCRGYGEQKLYNFEINMISEGRASDSRNKTIGFRRVKLVPQECNWYLDRFPFTQGYSPMTVELNGVQIFAKGSNWISPEVFPGLLTDEIYDTLTKYLVEMNGNFLRCWGGAVIGKDRFFEDCDRLGILVWQEFPLACLQYADDDHYLSVARAEATYIIKRLREHACLALWCGGNELYVGGSQNTPQFHIIRLLNSLCFKLDKNTPWLDTSPMFGMRHGHYTFRNSDREECFQSFDIVKATAYTEFGCPALASYDYLEKFMPKEDLTLEAVLEERPSWIAHHGVRAWTNDSWIQLGNIEHYFGKVKSLKDIIVKSQILQSMGYKLMFEEARRQKQNCNFALNWCFDEPYPNAASNCLVCYPAVRRPAYYAVENSLRDTVLSAKFKKFSWVEGEIFQAEIWMLSDGITPVKRGTAEVVLRMEDKEYSLMKWEYGDVETGKNKQGHTATIVLPKHKSCLFEVELRCEHREYNNSYKLLYYSKETAEFAASRREKPMDFDGITEETIGMEDVNVNF